MVPETQPKPCISPAKINQLYKEKLRKQSARSGSPLSRKEFLEQEELKQCTFSPCISQVSRSIAIGKSRTDISINDSLYSDAMAREERRKLKIINVFFSFL